MSREEIVVQEIQLYLSSFKVIRGRIGMTTMEKMESLEAGIRSFFEANSDEWGPLEQYIQTGWDEDEFGLALERLLVPELVLHISRYLREELGYMWLTQDRVFAYEYSF